MKTVLFINSSSARYYRREHGLWKLVKQPEPHDRLWIITNIPEETLDIMSLPLMFWRDRKQLLERRLVANFPRSTYRAAAVLKGNLFTPVTAVITGLTLADAVSAKLDPLDMPIAGVWGISILLALTINKLHINNVLIALPSVHFLRIVAIKNGLPVLTRCIHRYTEETDPENDANEIVRTRQHLDNRKIFEHDQIPPVLYLGDTTAVNDYLSRAGITQLALPDAFTPKGDAAYLHPLFECVTTSPCGQLAPLQLRARHLAKSLRQIAYTGIVLSALCLLIFGQKDARELVALHARETHLNAALEKIENERTQITGQIYATGMNPALVRQATQFSEREIEAAPGTDKLLQFTASVLSELPEVRIKTLTYRFPKHGERYCQGSSIFEIPRLSINSASGGKSGETGNEIALRYTELQFSILQNNSQTPATLIDIKRRLSAAIKHHQEVQLMQDPAAFSLINTLKGGIGMDTTQTDNLWCMSIPWKGEMP